MVNIVLTINAVAAAAATMVFNCSDIPKLHQLLPHQNTEELRTNLKAYEP